MQAGDIEGTSPLDSCRHCVSSFLHRYTRDTPHGMVHTHAMYSYTSKWASAATACAWRGLMPVTTHSHSHITDPVRAPRPLYTEKDTVNCMAVGVNIRLGVNGASPINWYGIRCADITAVVVPLTLPHNGPQAYGPCTTWRNFQHAIAGTKAMMVNGVSPSA